MTRSEVESRAYTAVLQVLEGDGIYSLPSQARRVRVAVKNLLKTVYAEEPQDRRAFYWGERGSIELAFPDGRRSHIARCTVPEDAEALANLLNTQVETLDALRALTEYCTSGRRYTTQNPYTVPEIKKALEVLKADLE